jgi:hypothetical protein
MALGIRHLEIMGHSLGINVYHAINSKQKRDKKLPEEYYQNRFCAGENHDDYVDLFYLEKLGYMARGRTINEGQDILWYVTEDGKDRFEILFHQYVNAR